MFTRMLTRMQLKRSRHGLRGFARARGGTTAVEFAMIAMPFFILLIGLIEICVMFVVMTVLEHGAREGARDIRTGEFQRSAAVTRDALRNDICDAMANLFDCENRITISVDRLAAFPASAPAVPLKADGTLQDESTLPFNPGGREDIVVVQVFFEWSLITPGLTLPLANYPDNQRLMIATVAFRNEPF